MIRKALPYLLQISPFAPMGAALAIVASQAQGDGFTAGGLIAAGVLCLVAYALIELPYYLPRDFGAKKKTPIREGSPNRGHVAKRCHENHFQYTPRKPI